jgi:hypothetical protein
MEWTVIVALFLGVLVMLVPVALIWYIIGGGIFHSLRDKSASKLVCSVDTDCPPGYLCFEGKCVPATN